jgi:hypothetical protein
MPSSASSSEAASGPSQRVRSVVSLILTLHLIVLAFALSSNYFRSPLQARVLQVLRPYAQLLNLELDFLPFHLTHAMADDVDHRIEVLPAGADQEDDAAWLVLPDRGWRGCERYARYQRLARLMGFLAEQDSSGAGAGMVARRVAENYVHQQGVEPARIRCRRHLLQSPEMVTGGTAAQRDPNDPSYFREMYVANTLVSDTGTVDLVKVDPAGEVARPDTPEN